MSDPDGNSVRPVGDGGGDDDPDAVAPTPFDNPFFLPVILLGFALWMGFDGWINQDFIQAKLEAKEEWKITFNQVGAGIAGALGAFSLYRALQERKAEAASQDG